jgi:hypothetical protein
MKPEELLAVMDRLAESNSRVDGLDVLNAVMADRSFATVATAREALSTALNALKDSGRVRLPVGRHLWDFATRVPIPKWIVMIREPLAFTAFNHRDHAWHPTLGFLAEETLVQGVDGLLAIDRWLRSVSVGEPWVPVKERSWEIFGLEKKLESFADTKWFGPGRVTLDVLRCYIVPHVPMHRVYREGAPVVAISENEAGFDSLCRLAAATKLFRCVVYGNGLAIEKSVRFLSELIVEQQLDQCVYVGDIDAAGIAIPQRLDVALRRACGKSVQPWLPAYEFMLRNAGDPLPSDSNSGFTWLPPDFHARAHVMIASGERVAQESFGWKQMISKLHTSQDSAPGPTR